MFFVLGWMLLIASLLLCLVGPHLSIKSIPSDINNRMGDADWIGLAWVLTGIVAGALALVCFAIQWALRPGRQNGAHQQQQMKSK
jgi:hypothetical protein